MSIAIKFHLAARETYAALWAAIPSAVALAVSSAAALRPPIKVKIR
jgi:hypothetical protein